MATRSFNFLYALVLCLSTALSFGQTVITDSAVYVSPVNGLLDETGERTYSDLAPLLDTQADSIEGMKCGTDFAEIKTGPAAYWLQYAIHNASNDTLVVLDFKNWTNVALYANDELIGKTGHFVPFNQRSMRKGNESFIQMVIPIGATVDVIARLQASDDFIAVPLNTAVRTTTHDNILAEDAQQRQYINFFLGIYFFIILYNFFVMLVTKSRAYLLYVGLIAINFFALAHNFGYTVELFSGWENYPTWHGQIDLTFSTLFGLSIMAFTSEFLRIRKNFPGVHKIFKVLGALLILVLIPSFLGYSFLAYNISSLVGLILFGVVLTVAIRAYRKGLPSSNYFLLAFGFFITGTVVFILKEVGVLPDMALTKYSLQIGTTFEAMLFAIALGDRINKLQLQNKKQQSQLIQQLKANEILQMKANLELEEKVKERTQEIQVKNAALELSNKHITESLNYAKNIQSSILSSHDALDANLIPNFVFFQPKELVSGDFYWSYQVNSTTIIWITADCTGHGVPGALMSIIGHVLLNKIVIEKGITKVDLILGPIASRNHRNDD